MRAFWKDVIIAGMETIMIALIAGVILGFLLGGCEMPESVKTVNCEVTNDLAITERYECTDGTYRCEWVNGMNKYKDCWFEGVYCVEHCT